MAVHHLEEHLNCYNYSRNGGPIDILVHGKGTRLSKDIQETELVCIISGVVSITTQKTSNQIIESGHILLMPPNTQVSAEILSDAYILVFIVNKPIQLCDLCPLESLDEEDTKEPEDQGGKYAVLKFNDRITDYFDTFIKCLNEGLWCYHYLEIKSHELMFMLRAFYDRRELSRFFRPLISNDTAFSDFIIKNYRNVKTVEELAKLSNYSRSGFKAHFRKTFGTSASVWLREKKARNVYHELTTTSKTLLQISNDFNFSSVSHMSIFCKEYFGKPPGKLRKEAGKTGSAGSRVNMGMADKPLRHRHKVE